jgi:hypothetical protein
MKKKALLFVVCVCFGVVALAPAAFAIPVLQLYIEGAVYNPDTETWDYTPTGSDPIILWVIGDVGSYGSIVDVKLSAAVDTSEIGGSSISLTSTTVTSGFTTDDGVAVVDPSTPIAPTATANSPSGDGDVPKLGDGTDLPKHGIYGMAGTSFFEWSLGDFTLTDSPIGDYTQGGCPGDPDDVTATCADSSGQINAYELTIEGFSGGVHFDAYDHIVVDNHAQFKFAPFSHDAFVPEPSTVSLLVVGGLFLVVGVIVRRKAHSVR